MNLVFPAHPTAVQTPLMEDVLAREVHVGRSNIPPQEALWRDWKTTGFVARSSSSAFSAAVPIW
jgi:hypothetical protein